MDKYERIKVVGRGAHGIVYLCARVRDGLPVIVKQIPVDAMTAQERQAALGEVHLLQLVNHPNIIGYYDYFMEENALCIVMEFARGGTLTQFLKERKGMYLDEDTILKLFVQILLSLHHLHSRQILHRDLKTQNILMNKNRTVCKLSDFGISKRLETGQSKAFSIVGTPNYCSPEMISDKAYNEKSDIWAMGCILYELCALRQAFEGDNMGAVVFKITRCAHSPIPEHYGEPLKKLIGTLLNLNAAKRPSTAELLATPLLIGPWLQMVLELGSIPCPKTSHKALTPKTSHKLNTQNSNNLDYKLSGQSSLGMSISFHHHVIKWGLGIPTPQDLALPAAQTQVCSAVCNGVETMAVTEQGRVVIWKELGEDSEGEEPEVSGPRPRYLKSSAPVAVSDVFCGDTFTAIITDRGMLLTMGNGANGCLGHGTEDDAASPRIVEALVSEAVVKVACGGAHVLALTADGELYAWGRPDNGRLGFRARSLQLTPVRVPVASDYLKIHSIHASVDASAVLATDGTVWAAGSNSFNKLGIWGSGEENQSTSNYWEFSPAIAFPSVDLLQSQPFSLGLTHSSLISDGSIYVIGSLTPGQLDFPLPRPVVLGAETAGPRRVACGDRYTVAITADQEIWTWGSGSETKLGRSGSPETPSSVRLPLSVGSRREILSLNVRNGYTVLCLKAV